MNKYLLSLVMLLFSISLASACTFIWTAPTTNTDGTPVTNLAGYRLYYGGVKLGPDIAAPATTLSTSSACQAGSYTVTAFNTQNVESPPSLPFVAGSPSAPGGLTVTK